MPIFYRGAGPGTYWDIHNAQLTGFTAHSPGIVATPSRLLLPIARGTVGGPYISLTRSFAVAWDYAVHFGRTTPAPPQHPGHVYEVEFDAPLPMGVALLDPVREVANNTPGPLETISYQHDGSQEFLLGVLSPAKMGRYRKAPCRQPPPATGTNRPANLSLELEALIRALRDSEILAGGAIPAACVRNRYMVHLGQ